MFELLYLIGLCPLVTVNKKSFKALEHHMLLHIYLSIFLNPSIHMKALIVEDQLMDDSVT